MISIVITTFVALHCGAWLWSVNRLAVLIEQQADRFRRQGWRVEPASAYYGGWPGQARVEAGPVTIAFGGLSVRAETLVAVAALANPGSLPWRSHGHALQFGSGPERPVLAADVAGEALPDGVALSSAATCVAELFEAEALRLRIKPNETMMTVLRLRPLDAGLASSSTTDVLELRIGSLSPAYGAASSHPP